ncbi:MAG: hypothetical protein OXN94_10480 [Chloroflexota bacterium]|nr:hypothetical protein [Chloroflexota bacterium]MDE2858261.1 hypothetical protein [Chloroflexota bacterium]MDE2950487.1 hypothetical protein [Chloroflexota bacterium]
MIKRIMLKAKRLRLIRLFENYEIRYHTNRLGEAMAREDSEFARKYHYDKIYEVIREICNKKRITHKDMCLIEDELNDRINGLVQTAYDKEAEKLKTREFIETRIKIKRVNGQNMAESVSVAEAN